MSVSYSREYPDERWAAVSVFTIDHIFSILATLQVRNVQSKSCLERVDLERRWHKTFGVVDAVEGELAMEK